ncbi:MAG: hypothetical protein ABI824_00055 [Acidobacteriota bacterium]
MYTWVQDQAPSAEGVTFEDSLRESFQIMIDAAGLKLEVRKMFKETIVVDHLEAMPTEN